MIMSPFNEINFVPSFIYVIFLLKCGSIIRKVVLRVNKDFEYYVIKNLLIPIAIKSILLFSLTVLLAPSIDSSSIFIVPDTIILTLLIYLKFLKSTKVSILVLPP